MQQLGVGLDDLPVFGAVARVHYQKDQFKRKLSVALEFLEQFRHQHRILAAGNADGNAIVGLNQIVCLDCLCKAAENDPVELLAQSLFHFGNLFVFRLPANLVLEPLHITTHQIYRLVSLVPELFRHVCAEDAAAAVDDQHLVPGQFPVGCFQFLLRDQHCTVNVSQRKCRFVPHINDLTGRRFHLCQFLYRNFFYHALTSPNRCDKRRLTLQSPFRR